MPNCWSFSRPRLRAIPTLLFAIFWLGVTLTPPAAAGPYMIGDIAFDLPKTARGWTSTTGEGGSLMLQKTVAGEDGSQGGAFIQVTAPMRQGAFEANFATMAGTIEELRQEDPIIERTGVTIDGYPITMRDVCCGYRDDLLLTASTVGVQLPDAQYFLMLVTINLDADQRQALEDDFAFAIRSLRARDRQEPSILAPPQNGGGLDGVFTSLQTNLLPNVFGGLDFTSESIIRNFDPSGLYSTQVLPAGISMQDHCRRVPTDCGTYVLHGGGWFGGAQSIEIADMSNDYGIIETETVPFSRDSDHLSIDGSDYHRIPPLQRGTPMSGTWRYLWASSGVTAMSSGSLSVERVLTMTPDGRFEMDGWSGFMSANEVGDTSTAVTGSHDRPNMSGQYEVDGYTLTLTGSDGTVKTLSLFEPDVGSDGLLVIDGGNYIKDEA